MGIFLSFSPNHSSELTESSALEIILKRTGVTFRKIEKLRNEMNLETNGKYWR